MKKYAYCVLFLCLKDVCFASLLRSWVLIMFNKVLSWFATNKETAEQVFMREHHLQYDAVHGYILNGQILNEWAERLEYFSNRKLKSFDDLKELFYKGMMIKEKIDLELAREQFVTRLGNNQENLSQLKHAIIVLNDYYHLHVRDK